MQIDPEAFRQSMLTEVEKLPHVSGSGREANKVYISRGTDTALNAAEKLASQMGDEYVSV